MHTLENFPPIDQVVSADPNTRLFNNDAGLQFCVRIVLKGDAYGLYDGLKHDEAKPLVEFYDVRYRHTKFGQFVSRYYVSTLLAGDQRRGLQLEGGIPEWGIDALTMVRVRAWLKGRCPEAIHKT